MAEEHSQASPDRRPGLGAPTLVITQFYRPEFIGSAPYIADVAEWLGRDRAVKVLAGLPHYPDADAFREHRRHASRTESVNGVAVERLRSWIPRKRSALARIASEMLFFLHGAAAIMSGRVRRAPVVITLCPSIFTVLLGVLACGHRGFHAAIVHDIQSGLAGGLGIVRSSLLQRAMRLCERLALNRTDLVIVLTEAMKQELRALHVTATIEVLPLWADSALDAAKAASSGAPIRVLYNGNMGKKQGLGQVIALAETLQVRRPDIEILMRGHGSERGALERQAVARGLRNLRFADLLPPDQFAAGLAEGDIHLVPQNPAASAFAIPSKIYNIMAAGRPFIATAALGSPLARLQRQTGAFTTVMPDDVDAFASAVEALSESFALRAEMGARGRRFVETHCAKSVVLDRLAAMVECMAKEGGRRAARGVLILEPETQGHQPEWLDHLARFALDRPDREPVWFVVGPEIYRDLCAELDGDGGDRVRLLPLGKLEQKLYCHQNLAVSAFARWWVLCRYLKRTRARRAHILAIDLLALPFALGLRARRRPVSGILFRPSVHYRYLGPYQPSRGERLRDLRKSLCYRLMLGNKAVERVLSLDAFFPRFARHAYGNGWKVEPVGDPAHPAVVPDALERRLAEQLPHDRLVFVLFGYLTERKGILVLHRALELLSPAVARRTAILLAGRVDAAIRPRLADARSRLEAKQPELWLKLEDRRLKEGEIEAIVGRCDVVLAPYQRFVGSSGVLYWAARKGKPLLTQNFGLLGALVQGNQLGLAIDTTDSRALAAGIEQMVARGPLGFFMAESAARFAVEHTHMHFATAVFAALGGEMANRPAAAATTKRPRSVAS